MHKYVKALDDVNRTVNTPLKEKKLKRQPVNN